jgi:hypothetical protein
MKLPTAASCKASNPKYKPLLIIKDLPDKDRSLIMELSRNSSSDHFDESKAVPDTISSVQYFRKCIEKKEKITFSS